MVSFLLLLLLFFFIRKFRSKNATHKAVIVLLRDECVWLVVLNSLRNCLIETARLETTNVPFRP